MGAIRTLRLVAITAIDGSVFPWLKRYLRLTPAIGTDGAIHWACLTVAKSTATSAKGIPLPTSRLFMRRTTFWTAARGIRQSPAGIKFLLPNSKGKCLIAIAAIQGLIGQGHQFFSILGSAP